jgi:hypothetical protein
LRYSCGKYIRANTSKGCELRKFILDVVASHWLQAEVRDIGYDMNSSTLRALPRPGETTEWLNRYESQEEFPARLEDTSDVKDEHRHRFLRPLEDYLDGDVDR